MLIYFNFDRLKPSYEISQIDIDKVKSPHFVIRFIFNFQDQTITKNLDAKILTLEQ